MKRSKQTKRKNNKKAILLRFEVAILLIFVIVGMIGYELSRTIFTDNEAWNEKANKTLNSTTEVIPKRGAILSDDGSVLAASLIYYSAEINTKSDGVSLDSLRLYINALGDSLEAFSKDHSPKSPRLKEKWIDTLKHVYVNKPTSSFILFRTVTESEKQRILKFPFFNRRNVTGLHFFSKEVRYKPYGMMAARSIGATRRSDDLNKDENIRYKKETHRIDSINRQRRLSDPNAELLPYPELKQYHKGLIGVTGLELALDSMLYGKSAIAEKIQMARGISDNPTTNAIDGYDITTTINITMQEIVEEQLHTRCRETNAKWGTAVLMEVATGEIKAITSLTRNPRTGAYEEGVNHAIRGYEPGSVMKPISMMVALEDGIVKNIDAPIPTGTSFLYCGKVIKDPHGGAALTPRQIIETSSNVGMAKLIISKYHNNPGGFRSRLEDLGFLEDFRSGIGGGVFARPPQIAKLGHTNGDRVSLSRMAFGYTTLLPPLYTLSMYNAIANDGKYVRPTIVRRFCREGEDSIVPVSYVRKGMWDMGNHLITQPVQVCSPENAEKLRIMLHDVVWGSRGTARNFLKSDLVEIVGKTGTCYTTEGGHYTNTKRLTFCGFFPYNNPKYSCIVVMEGANVGAAASSGLVLKNIALKLYSRGLLGNHNRTPKADAPLSRENSRPTLYATRTNHKHQKIAKSTGVNAVATVASPRNAASGTVPDVKGLALREAITTLEAKGITVAFSGTGFVQSQDIAAGTPLSKGMRIHLRLSH